MLVDAFRDNLSQNEKQWGKDQKSNPLATIAHKSDYKQRPHRRHDNRRDIRTDKCRPQKHFRAAKLLKHHTRSFMPFSRQRIEFHLVGIHHGNLRAGKKSFQYQKDDHQKQR